MARIARSAVLVAGLTVVSAASSGCVSHSQPQATAKPPSASPSPSVVAGSTSVPSAGLTPDSTPSATSTTIRASSSSASNTVPAAAAQNLPVSTTVRNQLIATWVRAQHISFADVAGTRPGSVYYGSLRSTNTSWAVADFTPSAEAIHAPGSDGPLVQFQDGPWVFSQPADGSWKLVTDSGGMGLCPQEVPQPLAEVWHLPDPAACPAR